ncbi:MAG: DNA polymerase I [Candidatus Omnitrophica bacterium]|nr:DNA polymerase I [Candidatus Omnitrophota bacterium]
MKKKIVLIDGTSFCYRAFYAIKRLSTSKGQPTNAVYGVITMLNKLLAEQKPNYLGFAFDLKGPTFRHKKYDKYKIQRKPMPDELSTQIPTIKKILKAYKVPIFEKDGYEADDVIATLAKKLSAIIADNKAGFEILVVTGDKDILQIVSDIIKVVNPHKDNLIMDGSWVKNNFGVIPERILDIMALAGDSSDNIPGVPGIGLTTAIDLVKNFGTLDEVLANTNNIKNKSRAEKIREFAAQAQMSRELAKLDSDIPQFKQMEAAELLEQLKVEEANKQALFEIFKELEFKTLLAELIPENAGPIKHELITEKEALQKVIKDARAKKEITIHMHALHAEPMRAEISGLALALDNETNYYISFKALPIDLLKPILEDARPIKIGHDLKFAKVALSNYGIALQGVGFDTMLAAYLLEPSFGKYDLEDLALEHLSLKLENPNHANEKQLAKASCHKANSILRLAAVLRNKINQAGMSALFEKLEMPLIDVLSDMEKNGVVLDKDFLLHLSQEFENMLKKLTKDIYEMAGEDFNINSPKQLSQILFKKLKLAVIKRTKTGFSTDTEVLGKLTQAHPIARTLLEFREVSKLKSTYVDGLLKLIHPKTGKIHTSFNQTGTATGRLSSSQPNLQNIPIKTNLGKTIRRAFVAEKKNHLLLSADYSQIELRILAHLSQDKKLISAFKNDSDIHSYTASLIFGVGLDEVKTQMRDAAKTVNFGIIYGMSAFGLAKDLSIAQDKAQEFIEAYFKRYTEVKKYMEQQVSLAQKHGFVTTLLKRRRYLPQINSENENIRQFAQRAAINAPVQGSASDLIKTAMIEIHKVLTDQYSDVKMLLQVHDELVFSVDENMLEHVKSIIKEKMENAIKLRVPIKVSIKTGKNWMEMN